MLPVRLIVLSPGCWLLPSSLPELVVDPCSRWPCVGSFSTPQLSLILLLSFTLLLRWLCVLGLLLTCMSAVGIFLDTIRATIAGLRGLASSLEAGLHHYEASAVSGHLDLDIESQGPLEFGSPSSNLVSLPVASSPERAVTPAEAYRRVAQSISPAPDSCFDLCVAIPGSREEVQRRVQRAWEAGLWSKAVLDGFIAKPRPTPKIALKPSCYIVVRAPGVSEPCWVTSSNSFFRLVPRFTGTPLLTPSHPLQREGYSAVLWVSPSLSTHVESEAGGGRPSGSVCSRMASSGGTCCGRSSLQDRVVSPGLVSRGWLPSRNPIGLSPFRGAGEWTQCCGRQCGGPIFDHRGACCGRGRARIEQGTMIAVLLVDFLRDVERGMSEFDPDQELREIQPFWPDAPELMPSSAFLMQAAMEWCQSEEESRVHFYSAAEEAQPLAETVPKKPTPKRSSAPPGAPAKDPAKPKRVTTAALADQVASLAQSIPALVEQVQKISEQQQMFEVAVKKDLNAPRIPPYRMPFGSPDATAGAGDVKKFAALVGSPPPCERDPVDEHPKGNYPRGRADSSSRRGGFPCGSSRKTSCRRLWH